MIAQKRKHPEVSLADKFPDLVKEWHPDNPFSPHEVSPHSNKKVWWICSNSTECGCRHEYEAFINNRTKKKPQNCPFRGCCKVPKQCCIHESIVTTHPRFAVYWDQEKNKRSAATVTHGSNIDAFWKCPNMCEHGCKHEWRSEVYAMTSKTVDELCPFCSGQSCCSHTSLEAKFPDIAKDWHYEKNYPLLPSQVPAFSNIEVWWKCPTGCSQGCEHTFQAAIGNRTRQQSGCTFRGCCTRPRLCCPHTSLKAEFPVIAETWDEKQNDKMPDEVLPYCNDEFWWKCSLGHSWKQQVDRRVKSNCPFCHCNKNEEECREIFQRLTGRSFPKTKRVFSNPLLELDGYCAEEKIGFEYQGEQHSQFPNFFHRTEIEFRKQLERDQQKRDECVHLGLRLIEVPYTLSTYDEKEAFIRSEVEKAGIPIVC